MRSAIRRPRRVRGLGLALVVAVVAAVLALPAPAAQAHTFLVGSNPSDGQLLDVAPDALRLDFSESVVLGATQVDVVDGLGRHHPPAAIELVADDAGASGEAVDTEQPVQVLVTLPALDRGTYRVTWKTLSSDDLHQASGVLAFGIGEAVGAAGSVDEAPGSGEALARWLLWSCLAGVLGPLAVAALGRRSLTGRRRDRLVRLARWSAVGMLVASVVLPAAQLRSVRQALLAAQDPAIGVDWGARVLAALAVAALGASAVRQLAGSSVSAILARRPGESVLLAAGLLVVPVTTAVRGHIWSSSRPLVAADVVHMLAAATWVGAVVALAVAHLGRSGPRPVVRARSFAALSASCVALAVATGLLLAGHGVSTTTALARATYGRTVLVKLGLIAVALGLALVNHRRGRADGVLGLGGRRWVAVEASVLVAVLGAAGVLAATSPANSPQWTPAPPPTRSVALHADDLLVQVSIGPNAPGPAYANISVLQTRRPAPAPVRAVRLTLHRNGSAEVTGAATRQSDGTWALPLKLPEPGRWRVAVAADRMGLPTATTEATWVVAGGVHGPDGRSLGAFTGPLSAAVVVAWLLALAVARRTRRGPVRRRGRPAFGSGVLAVDTPAAERAVTRVSSVATVALLASLWTPGPLGVPDTTATEPTLPTSAVQLVDEVPTADPGRPVGPFADRAPSQTVVAPPPAEPALPPAVEATLSTDRTGPWGLPSALLDAYEAAVRTAPAGCHLPVSLLAAIGQVESGSLAGRSLDAQHRAVPPVLGPVLDGRTTAAISDTDDGRLDADRVWDRAVGPMQFIPSTWALAGVDADHDGRADPQDVDDAAAAAAGYLCAGGRDLATTSGLHAAVLSYNHSSAYLRTVLSWQQRFAVNGLEGERVTLASGAPSASPSATPSATPTSTPSWTPSRTPTPVASPATPAAPTAVAPEPTSTLTSVPTSVPTETLPPEQTALPTETAAPSQITCAATASPSPTATPTPDPTSDPGATTTPPPIVAPTDVAGGCVPAQPTETPTPPVNTAPPGEPVLPTDPAPEPTGPAPTAAPTAAPTSAPAG